MGGCCEWGKLLDVEAAGQQIKAFEAREACFGFDCQEARQRTALSNRLARLQGYLFRAAFLRRIPLFTRNLIENVLLCLVASGIESSAVRWLTSIELEWRDVLTARIHKSYFMKMAYYKLNYVDRQIASPEQRICEDLPALCRGVAGLSLEWVQAAVDAAFYAVMLQRYSKTNTWTAVILGYVIGCGAFTSAFAPNFGKLFKRQSENEGTYRQLHARLRANAEPVALYGGIHKEAQVIESKFQTLVRHNAQLLAVQLRFGIWQDFLLKYLGATVAVGLVIGPFFQGHMRPADSVAGRAQMLSNMRYHTSVVISMFHALGTLASSVRKLMKLGAFADRISELENSTRILSSGDQGGTGTIEATEDEIAFEGATVVTPANATLVRDLTLRVPSGTNLLVTGPNGSGKSSLFRVLGGLWPLTEGKMCKPGGQDGGDGLSHDIFYVPQRPYVTIGTLPDQLIYPLVQQENEKAAISDKELLELLRKVDLEGLATRDGGLTAVADWDEVLSLGEQQRLGMARLFYHRPKFAILDECTSGVTVDMEERFCNIIKELGCTCVTISHRPALMAFHDQVLALDGEGGWSLHSGARSHPTPSSPPPTSSSPHKKGLAQVVEEDSDLISSPSTAGKAASPSQPWNLQRSSSQMHAADGSGKRRGGEAAANLEGMRRLLEQASGSLHGDKRVQSRVLTRAPAFDPQLHRCRQPASSRIKPRARTTWEHWGMVMRELWTRGGWRAQSLQLGTIAGVVLLRTLLQDRIAALNGRSVQLVVRQDLPGFVRLIGVSVLQSAASAVLAPSLRHVADALALRWRSQLTAAAASRYFRGNAFYAVAELAGMQDVDQRLTRDVVRLCDDLAALIPNLVKPVVDLLWFSAQLWQLTGRRGLGILYLYALIGFLTLKAVTPDFGALAAKENRLEAAFRNVHLRLRKHAESIAFFGGGSREGGIIIHHFQELMGHLKGVAVTRWGHAIADDFFSKQLPHNVTWVLTLLYALDRSGDFEQGSAAQGRLVDKMRYLASVVTTCFTSFGELLALTKRFNEISGGMQRVSEMLDTMDQAARLPAGGQSTVIVEDLDGAQAGIEFLAATVASPSGHILARQLDLPVHAKHSMLVTGPNGSGKSSIIRVLGGLWPLASGQVRRPAAAMDLGSPKHSLFFVPQRPYTTTGTLQEQVVYPQTITEAAAAMDNEWGETLSLGEQQRLGMARLFYHQPKFAVLDECTNATSVDVEEHLYQEASSLGITLITITQRTALVKYHTAELRLLDGSGDWELRSIGE
ncbi:hypothetical protein WJX84_012088 [Apatococcus fuscideae]|uniref:ABC transporter domain-containing protein n=1 Tax=Apatococcus fuscideae TaxID=2026836 RepID=A0AAW1T673_9CHLO